MTNHLKRILIGLDLSVMDDTLIQFTQKLSHTIGPEALYFVHIAGELELPEQLSKNYPELLAPLDESIARDISNKITKVFGDKPEMEIDVIVREGESVHDLIKIGKIKNVDLVIFGKKPVEEGSGLIPKKIASRSPYSVLMVPAGKQFSGHFDSILVATDFSEYSAMALEQALVISKPSSGKVHLQHIYNVPLGYYKTGKSFEEFSDIMKGHAQKDMTQFLFPYEAMKDRIEPHFSLRKGASPSDLIAELAEQVKASLIIIGSKGRTGSAGVILGSIADGVVNQLSTTPILVLKRKNENLSFFEALMKV